MILIGYRFSETGVFGYEFYNGSSSICTVSSIVAPSAPVIISGCGLELRSNFELRGDIAPGVTRSIINTSNERELFQIVYKGANEYEINGMVLVKCEAERYTFYRAHKPIAEIKRLSDTASVQKPQDTYYDYEPYFDVSVENDLNTDFLMMILSFPMLRF